MIIQRNKREKVYRETDRFNAVKRVKKKEMGAEVRQKSRLNNRVGDLMQPYATFFQKMAI